MIANQLNLTEKQVNSFDRFLVDGTQKALSALDDMFGLDIECSDSCFEIASAIDSENLKHLGDEPLYTVSSAMVGDMRGRIFFVMRASDFKHLSKAMKPMLDLLFCADIDADLTPTNSHANDQPEASGQWKTEEDLFHEQMMDTLSEMANVFIGLYTRAIHGISKLTAHYSVPYAIKDPNQEIIRHFLWAPEASEQLHLVIQNEFFMMNKPVKLWCLFSLERKSLARILRRIERLDELHPEPVAHAAAA
jgi:chemotaxis protein CheY-P-specific phosphatase CheC